MTGADSDWSHDDGIMVRVNLIASDPNTLIFLFIIAHEHGVARFIDNGSVRR